MTWIVSLPSGQPYGYSSEKTNAPFFWSRTLLAVAEGLIVATLLVAFFVLTAGRLFSPQAYAVVLLLAWLFHATVFAPMRRDAELGEILAQRGYRFPRRDLVRLSWSYTLAEWEGEVEDHLTDALSPYSLLDDSEAEERFVRNQEPGKVQKVPITRAVGQLPSYDEARLLPVWDDARPVESMMQLLKLRSQL